MYVCVCVVVCVFVYLHCSLNGTLGDVSDIGLCMFNICSHLL